MENTSKRTGVFLWCEEGHPNNSRKASSTFLTGMSSIFIFFRSMPDRLCLGISIRWNPSFSASLIRCSMRLTGRISPLRPTSPAIHTPASISASMLLDRMALITAKSMAGSLTFSPPAMFRNTSFEPA